MRAYLFDIDGTLADGSHRVHHLQQTPKNWDGWYGEIHLDKPIRHIMELAKILRSHADLVFVTGRSDHVRRSTREWLSDHGLGGNALFMRKFGDHRDDDIVKGELLDEVLAVGYRPIMAFDDRSRVVAMWRARGVPCAQVAPGDF